MVPIRNWAGLIRVGNLKRLSEKLEAEVSTSPAENEGVGEETQEDGETTMPVPEEVTKENEPASATAP